MKKRKELMRITVVAGCTALCALVSACGQTTLSPIAASHHSMLKNSTPNAIVLRAEDLPTEPWQEIDDFFEFSDVGTDGLVVLFSNRPLSCASVQDTIGCASHAGWLVAVPLPADADLSEPIALSGIEWKTAQVYLEGADGCTVSGCDGPGKDGELLTFAAVDGVITAELAGIADFRAGSVDGAGNVTDLTYSVNGTYETILCSGVTELNAL